MSAKYLCPCKKITKQDVKDAVKAGASSYKEVKKATGLASKCGHCKNKAKKYIKKRLKKMKAA